MSESLTLSTMEVSIRAAHDLPTNHLVLNYLLEVSREIPDNANDLDSAMAEYLAGRFLKGLDLCGELYALSVSYEMKMELVKKKEFSDAMIIRAVPLGIKTAKEKEMYAHADLGYLEAAERHITAKMFRTLIEEKREAFYKAHYLMRKIVDRDVPTDGGNRRIEIVSDKTEWPNRTSWSE